MPILHIDLVAGNQNQAQIDTLMLRCSEYYADVLKCPIDRVRVFVNEVPTTRACIGGVLAHEGAPAAPFFTALALEGRSLEDRHTLLEGFTEILVEVLHCDRSRVRGMIDIVHPENWAIAGVPASVVRKSEIQARADAARLDQS